nr:hypothetical protein CFP56_20388 [Quercus suber]
MHIKSYKEQGVLNYLDLGLSNTDRVRINSLRTPIVESLASLSDFEDSRGCAMRSMEGSHWPQRGCGKEQVHANIFHPAACRVEGTTCRLGAAIIPRVSPKTPWHCRASVDHPADDGLPALAAAQNVFAHIVVRTGSTLTAFTTPSHFVLMRNRWATLVAIRSTIGLPTSNLPKARELMPLR